MLLLCLCVFELLDMDGRGAFGPRAVREALRSAEDHELSEVRRESEVEATEENTQCERIWVWIDAPYIQTAHGVRSSKRRSI